MAQAKNVKELRSELETIQGVPWSYVVASDADGEVFFGDISTMPGLSSADITRCVVTAVGALHLPHGIIVLDGTRSECQWHQRMAAADQPQTIRTDYVANSNNTYELPNPAEPLTGFSPVLAGTGKGLSLRANLGLHMIEDRLSGDDQLGPAGFSGRLARKTFRKTRNRGAELLVDGIVADFKANPTGEYNGTTVDLTEACEVLDKWDRRNQSSSRGAALFRGLWMILPELLVPHSALFQIPASLDQPLTTPSGYTTDPAVRKAVRDALARVVVTLAEKDIATDVRWGDVNKVLTPSGEFSIPGGSSAEGIFDSNVSSDAFYTFDGWVSTLDGNVASNLYGASYLHSVELGRKTGPRAKGLLPYGQATDPASPWYLDQTKPWSKNRWFSFPFAEWQIAADPELTTMELKMP